MSNKQINRILPGIQSYAWSGDCSKVAVCPMSSEILVFETNQSPDISKWRLLQVLKEVSILPIINLSFSSISAWLAHLTGIPKQVCFSPALPTEASSCGRKNPRARS